MVDIEDISRCQASLADLLGYTIEAIVQPQGVTIFAVALIWTFHLLADLLTVVHLFVFTFLQVCKSAQLSKDLGISSLHVFNFVNCSILSIVHLTDAIRWITAIQCIPFLACALVRSINVLTISIISTGCGHHSALISICRATQTQISRDRLYTLNDIFTIDIMRKKKKLKSIYPRSPRHSGSSPNVWSGKQLISLASAPDAFMEKPPIQVTVTVASVDTGDPVAGFRFAFTMPGTTHFWAVIQRVVNTVRNDGFSRWCLSWCILHLAIIMGPYQTIGCDLCALSSVWTLCIMDNKISWILLTQYWCELMGNDDSSPLTVVWDLVRM